MRIAMSGASGFVGSYLTTFFTQLGHEVVPLGRAFWVETAANELIGVVESCQVVINLAGATINKRWSDSYVKEMYESRIGVTSRLVAALHKAKSKPALFISVSAVGYYATTGSHSDYSGSTKGKGLLADLCEAWEAEAAKAPQEVRLVVARLGIVLAPHGGALQKMLLPLSYFRMATVIAPGNQPFPWIGLEDLARSFLHIIHHQELEGVVNVVAPLTVTQREFTRALALQYKALFTIKLPVLLFKVLYGKGAYFVTTGQSVIPAKLVQSGFTYVTPTVASYSSFLYKEKERSVKLL
ncbi:MAG: TIGR01777 family oxidoreductase [Phocaeicola sp.]